MATTTIVSGSTIEGIDTTIVSSESTILDESTEYNNIECIMVATTIIECDFYAE